LCRPLIAKKRDLKLRNKIEFNQIFQISKKEIAYMNKENIALKNFILALKPWSYCRSLYESYEDLTESYLISVNDIGSKNFYVFNFIP
jgi:hypothetical protein